MHRCDPATGQVAPAKRIIVQILDQAYAPVRPWDLAVADLIWPMPGWGQKYQAEDVGYGV